MLKFAQKTKNQCHINAPKWRMLIVDDEPYVHDITKSVLKKFVFEGKGLEFFSAYNSNEAIELLEKESDIAFVLLDVVMDSDDAGLRVAKAIREEIGNKDIRIVLRTGQPGTAPEKDVIAKYDINDYREKTELTSRRLFTTVISSLRAYRDLVTIKKNKKGLKKIIESSRVIFRQSSFKGFAKAVLKEIPVVTMSNGGFFASYEGDGFVVKAVDREYYAQKSGQLLTDETVELFYRALENKRGFFGKDCYVGYFESENNKNLLLYLDGCSDPDEIDRNLLEIFLNNIQTAFNNTTLHEEIVQTQSELISTLGELIESRSKETSNHVSRVAKVSYVIAKSLGLGEKKAKMLQFASPMHDVGKVGIPDEVLNKPAKLNDEEFELMKKHTTYGWEILKNSKREIFQLASTIAYEHHERWDGTGYPRGLKGEEISIYGRITAVADVFDALSHKRVYKDAWEMDKVLEYIKEQSGKQFDPAVVEAFFNNIENIKSFA